MITKALIETVDLDGLRKLLSENPELANAGIPLEGQDTNAHPLHRICDGVFAGKYTDQQAVAMAKIFLAHGANVNGGEALAVKKDTPLIAAASLLADEVAILYIDNGANIHHAGTHGGTALHWAAWCGRSRVVNRLIHEQAAINKKCIDFEATPLLWTIHGYKHDGGKNRHEQIGCARMLIGAGADKNIPNAQGRTPFELLDKEDLELIDLLR
jgi:uncharacterized protein